MKTQIILCCNCDHDTTPRFFTCDEDPDALWCTDCFALTACSAGVHGEGCATQVNNDFPIPPPAAQVEGGRTRPDTTSPGLHHGVIAVREARTSASAPEPLRDADSVVAASPSPSIPALSATAQSGTQSGTHG